MRFFRRCPLQYYIVTVAVILSITFMLLRDSFLPLVRIPGHGFPEFKVSEVSGNADRAAVAYPLGMILSDQDAENFQRNQRHSFNAFLSDKLPIDRTIPDFRNKACTSITEDGSLNLPKVSVIICFHNEHQSVLLRTVSSIVRRSPDHLLHEILLVDDASNLDGLVSEHLQSKLKSITNKASLIKLHERHGLIRARLRGAQTATSPILIFMDSHCEVMDGWLEPLLLSIAANPSNVICPVIDSIDSHSFRIIASPNVRGGFNWGLHFKWEPLSRFQEAHGSRVDPFQSPAMSGGIFAINRKFFFDIGSYDEKMDIWGGENVDLSLRIWMCGGTLLIHPCSHVAHIFRDQRPYGNNGMGDTQLQNSVRVARVWLDEYINRFYEVRPEAESIFVGDLGERRAIRDRLQCRPFKWYVDNIYPELLATSLLNQPSSLPHSSTRKLRLQFVQTDQCLSVFGGGSKGAKTELGDCSSPTTVFRTADEWPSFLMINKKLCLDAAGSSTISVQKCTFSGGSQEFQAYPVNSGLLIWAYSTGLCLGFTDGEIKLMSCNAQIDLVLWNVIVV